MNTGIGRNQKILIALFCLLIHVIMMLTFITMEMNKHEYQRRTGEPLILIDDSVQLANPMPLVAQNPTSTVSPIPTTPPAAQPTTPTQPPETKPTPLVAMNGAGKQDNASTAPSAPPLVQPKPVAAPVPIPQPEPDLNPAQLDEETLNDTIARATQFLTLQKSAEKQIKPAEKKIAKPTFTSEKNEEKSTHASTEPVESKKITLAHIANRFMEKMAEEQTGDEGGQTSGFASAAMAVKSNNRGKASMQQIMYVNYCQKILSCLVTSYRISKAAAPRSVQTQPACIKMVLNKNGSIGRVSILQSSGSGELDNYMLAMFNDAGSSFPPVPSSFNEPFELPVFNITAIEQFQYVEHWFIQ